MGCSNIVTAEDGEAALEALHVRCSNPDYALIVLLSLVAGSGQQRWKSWHALQSYFQSDMRLRSFSALRRSSHLWLLFLFAALALPQAAGGPDAFDVILMDLHMPRKVSNVPFASSA